MVKDKFLNSSTETESLVQFFYTHRPTTHLLKIISWAPGTELLCFAQY